MTKPTPDYNEAQWFAVQFADILEAAATGDALKDKEVAENLMEGFEIAINDWLCYHEDACKSYRELHARFLGIARD